MAAKDNKDAKAVSSGKAKEEVEKGKAIDATKAKDEKSKEKKDKEEELCNVYLEIAIGGEYRLRASEHVCYGGSGTSVSKWDSGIGICQRSVD
jgi:hypothetical protein